MDIVTIAKKEFKLGFRNPWSYTFLLVFSLFSISLLFINADSQAGIGQYTSVTGTMMNLILYFLPLMTLLLGSFSITSEKEDGSWSLLLTYPIKSSSWISGKFIGLYIVIITIVSFGFGVAGVIGSMFDIHLPSGTGLFLLTFALLLALVFLALAIFIGTISKNRWQALTLSVSVWMILVLAWPIIMITFLSALNYQSLKSALEFVTLFNPTEFTRIFMITKLGGGSVFGPEYIHWVGWIQSAWGTYYFIILCIIWVNVFMTSATYICERGRRRG